MGLLLAFQSYEGYFMAQPAQSARQQRFLCGPPPPLAASENHQRVFRQPVHQRLRGIPAKIDFDIHLNVEPFCQPAVSRFTELDKHWRRIQWQRIMDHLWNQQPYSRVQVFGQRGGVLYRLNRAWDVSADNVYIERRSGGLPRERDLKEQPAF